CLRRLEAGDIDLLTAIAYTPQRAKRYDFSTETVLVNWGQIYVPPNAPLDSLLDLQDKNIAVLKGDVYYQGLQDLLHRFEVDARFVELDTYPDVLDAVSRGEVDAGLTNRIFGLQFEADYNVARSPIVLSPIELRFAATKDRHAHLLRALDIHLAALKQDPQSAYYRSLGRWLGNGVEPVQILPAWLRWTLAIVAGALALALAIDLFLRAQVRTRTAELAARNQALQQEIARREEAEARMRMADVIISTVQNLILVADEKGDIIFAAPSVTRVLGYRVEEVLGDGWWACSRKDPAEAEAEKRRIIAQAAADANTGQLVSPPYERCLYDRQGNPHWILWQDTRGPNHTLIGIGADITERKEAEESLRASETRYRLLVENTTVGIVVHCDGEIVFANPAAARIFGLADRQALIGQPVMRFVHPTYRDKVRRRMQNVLKYNLPAPPLEERLLRLDGREIIAEVAGIPIT
ncbi:MAG: PAS domain S-box protein, partial [Caldilineae bacterium]